jgi:hypothetical protein
MAHVRHEHDNPSSDSDFAATIKEEEDSTYPGDSVCEGQFGLIERSTSLSTWSRRMILSILGSCLSPEGAGGIDEFKSSGSSLEFIISLCNPQKLHGPPERSDIRTRR